MPEPLKLIRENSRHVKDSDQRGIKRPGRMERDAAMC